MYKPKAETIISLTFLVWTEASFGVADPTDTFQPYISETLTYDDNLFRRPRETNPNAPIDDSKRWDLINRLSAGLKTYIPVSRQEFFIEGKVDDNRFVNHDNLNHVSAVAKGAWKWQLGTSLGGILGYDYRQYLGRFTNTDFFGKDLITDNSALVDINYKFNPRWRLNGQYRWLNSEHGAAERQFLDLKSNTGIIGLHYKSPDENTIGIQYTHTDARLPNRERILSALIDNQYQEHELSALYKWQITGKSLVEGRVGYRIRKHKQFSQRDYEGEAWRFNYQWTPTGKTTITLSGWGDLLNKTSDITASYVITRGVSITPTWSVTPKIDLQATFSWEEWQYAGDPKLRPDAKTDEDTILIGRLSASYNFSDHGELNIVYEKGHRNSTRKFGDYEYNAVFANTILKF
ncbi:XrtB/PEP-CTERM-associated polysaccharide biosynthesis outer membrane protein EpsL [Methylocaldum szegediense]|jgi:exopolysaccharide biosynthesis operon protein EpsL|uniref:Exopolysaccharide biosynthesis operon protein EpsL n=1 Tax=Methylocaldum szegediense TaxID=73780 RepID=A0ABM9HW11_9GAMM|nr:XrtB/PEP-CTERM-associated polysaccharide biosynthesis outer membrane protein EpsL [Methylocaldum szegediense]CAI8724186.1 Exopolysaccharide biosynthesis operon protein EpsL [Methylocaldum szegediense]